MNINMNMQPMFMNINMAGQNSYQVPYNLQHQHQQPPTSFSQHAASQPITLDVTEKSQKEKEAKKNWVDDWK